MRPLIAVLGLLCCAGVRVPPGVAGACVTECGMTATEGDCVDLQRVEDLTLATVAKFEPLTPARMCRDVNGWRIVVHPRDAHDRDGCLIGWQLLPGFCAQGFTDIDAKTIHLDHARWQTSSLAHEMVHVAELRRLPRGGHCLWNGPVKHAIESITGRRETAEPEAGWCP